VFNGYQWKSRDSGNINQIWWDPEPAEGEEVLTQTITQYRQEGGVLFAIPTTNSITIDSHSSSMDLNGDWKSLAELQEIETTAQSVLRDPRRPRPFTNAQRESLGFRSNDAMLRRGIYTYIPQEIHQELQPLIRELIGGLPDDAPALDRALAITNGLTNNYTYSDTPQDAPNPNPLMNFLFQSRSGNCEYFSTALAIMLRSEGIPSRITTGFYGGEWNSLGNFIIIRQSQAHAWVEAWFPDRGWVMLDATPALETQSTSSAITELVELWRTRWQGMIIDYTIVKQINGLRSFFRWTSKLTSGDQDAQGPQPSTGLGALTGAAMLIGILVLASLVVRLMMRWMAGEMTTQREARSPVMRIHRWARMLVSFRGWAPPDGLPPAAAADWLIEAAGDGAAPLSALTWLMYNRRYGDQATGSDWRDALTHLFALWRTLPRHRARPAHQ
jgi:transglutaminase-like putative cysteine protease